MLLKYFDYLERGDVAFQIRELCEIVCNKISKDIRLLVHDVL